jgi:hypothetical protein
MSKYVRMVGASCYDFAQMWQLILIVEDIAELDIESPIIDEEADVFATTDQRVQP